MADYVSIDDIVDAVGLAAVLSCLDDNSDESPDDELVAALTRRASRWVDSYLARVYTGTIPITGDVPALVFEATLYVAIAFMYERRPEYVRQNDDARRDWRKLARQTLEDMADGKQLPTDGDLGLGAPVAGGIVYDVGPRMTLDATDGTTNGGDL